MSDKLDKYLERIQKMDQIAKMAEMAGLENDAALLMDVEVAGSGLSYSEKALNRAYTRCVHSVVAKQLNPPANVDNIPPLPVDQPFIIAGLEVETGKPVWFLQTATCEGVTIAAMSGAGKSVTEARLLMGVPDSVFLYAPDTKRDIWRIFRALNRKFLYVRPHDLPFNLLECPIKDASTYYGGLIEKIASVLMSDGQTWPDAANVLAKVRESLGKDEPMISMNQAIQLFRDLAGKTGKEKYNTFADRLSVAARALGKNANMQKGAPVLSRYSALGIDFSGVSIQVRHAIENMFLYQLMQTRLSRGFAKGVDVIVCYDESIETYSKSFNTVAGSGRVRFQEMFCSQGRTFNFGRIILGQYLSQLAETVLSNTRILIVLRLADPAEARLAVRHLGLSDEFIPVIQNLPDGHAFIKVPGLHTVQIRVELVELGNFPSDEDIALAMADELKWVAGNSTYDTVHQNGCGVDKEAAEVIANFTQPTKEASNESSVEPERVIPATLLADWVEFLNEVLATPSAASTQHGKNLKWGMYKTARVKKELTEAGLITATKQNTSGRPAERLLVTRKGIVSLEALKSNDKK